MAKVWPYSLSFLCQILPDLCKLAINLNPYLSGTIASIQINCKQSFSTPRYGAVSNYDKIAQIITMEIEREARNKGYGLIHNQTL